MRKFKVAVDIDGCIWDLVGPWLEEYNKLSSHEDISVNDIKSYYINEYVTYPEVLYSILDMQKFWGKLNLYDGVYESIKSINERPDVDLVIATSTSYKTRREKYDRLFELLPMIDEKQLVVTSRKDILSVHFMVDDWENNLRHMARSGNGVPILINQPYNAAFTAETFGILRAKNLKTAIKAIEGYINVNMF